MDEASYGENYVPFRSFGEWTAKVTTSAVFNDYVAVWEAAKNEATESDKAAALDFVMRSAALETGAIEGLYQTPRGVTVTVAMQAAAWQTTLHDLGDQVQGHFEAQLDAFETIFDVATEAKPISEVWIRELHEIGCRNQATYRVETELGPQEQPLRLGEYKHDANHVRLRDDLIHFYCLVLDVVPEMERLLRELNGIAFGASPPVVQTAYFHHAFTSIHPFADGNGRVARAAASAFLYRAAGIPLVVFAGQSDDYFRALEAADDGNSQAFVQFIEDRALDTLAVVTQRLGAVRAERMTARLVRMVIAHRGLTHAEIEAVGQRVIHEVQSATSAALGPKLVPGFEQSHQAIAERCDFGRPYHSPPGTNGFRIRVHGTEPVEARSDCTPMLGIADDVSDRYVFTMIDANRPHRAPLQLRLDEVHPNMTEAGRLKIETWTGSAIGALLEELSEGIRQGLAARGYRSTSYD